MFNRSEQTILIMSGGNTLIPCCHYAITVNSRFEFAYASKRPKLTYKVKTKPWKIPEEPWRTLKNLEKPAVIKAVSAKSNMSIQPFTMGVD